MKKFLVLTLVLFLSLFIVEESRAERVPLDDERILSKGEVLASGYSVNEDGQRLFDVLVRYKGYVYWCWGDKVRRESDFYINTRFFCGEVNNYGN